VVLLRLGLRDVARLRDGRPLSQRNTRAREARATAERARQRTHKDAAGRLHLTLLRDPASGQEQVTLTTPVFEEDWQNEIATAAANTAHATLRGAPSLRGVVDLARNAMRPRLGSRKGCWRGRPKGRSLARPAAITVAIRSWG